MDVENSRPNKKTKGGDKMYIGIDLHKETCYATTLDKEGGIIDRIRAEANSHSCEGRQRCDNTNDDSGH